LIYGTNKKVKNGKMDIEKRKWSKCFSVSEWHSSSWNNRYTCKVCGKTNITHGGRGQHIKQKHQNVYQAQILKDMGVKTENITILKLLDIICALVQDVDRHGTCDSKYYLEKINGLR